MHNCQEEESKQIVATTRSLDPVEFIKRNRFFLVVNGINVVCVQFCFSGEFQGSRERKYLFNAQNFMFGRDSYHVGKVGKGAKPIMIAFSSGTNKVAIWKIEFVI